MKDSEARVDWEKEALKVWNELMRSWFDSCTSKSHKSDKPMIEPLAKALSNAFEKGREAR